MKATNEMRKAGFNEDFIEHTLDVNGGEIGYSDNVSIEDIEDVKALQTFMKNVSKIKKTIVITLHFKAKVEELDLSECELDEIAIKWDGNKIKKILFWSGVKNISLSNIERLTELDFSGLANLEDINIYQLQDLQTINMSSNTTLKGIGIYNCRDLTELKLPEEYEEVEFFTLINNGNIPNYNRVEDLFVLKNLNKVSDKRGAASIVDTGLFDFKIKH